VSILAIGRGGVRSGRREVYRRCLYYAAESCSCQCEGEEPRISRRGRIYGSSGDGSAGMDGGFLRRSKRCFDPACGVLL